MESEIAGWLSVVFRFVHVLAAIMWIGNSLLFTWMEFNLIPPRADEEAKGKLGHLDMLHGGGIGSCGNPTRHGSADCCC
jgi:uncharacterized membrane protein